MSIFRKILLSILLLAVAGGIGFGIYWVFFASTGPSAPGTIINVNTPGVGGELTPAGAAGERPVVPTGSGTGTLPGAALVARGGVTLSPVLAATETLGATLTLSGDGVNYYDRLSGKFFSVNTNGTVRALSPAAFPNVQSVTWSADGTHAVLTFPDGAKLSYNFTTQQQTTLPSAWENFSFAPDSTQLAAKSMGETPGSRYLIIAEADGSNPRFIEPLGENGNKVQVNWSPAGDVIATSFTGEPTTPGSKEMLFIGQNGENFKSTDVKGVNFTGRWSPDGMHLLYSASSADDGFRPRLWTVAANGDTIGNDRRSIDLFTLATKCAFSGASAVYCAVPDAVQEGAGLSPEVLNGIPDAIYRVNLLTGAITLIGRPDTDTTIERLSVSADAGTLFFVDQATGNIKKMLLK